MAVLTLSSTGTLGDHFPFLALGRMLVDRGHQVRYAGPSYLQSHVESCGMQFHKTRPERAPTTVQQNAETFDHWTVEKGGPEGAAARAQGLDQEVELYDKLFFDEQLEDVMQACEGADLLISSQLQSIGRMVSDLMHISWITVCVPPWFYPTPGTAAAAGIAAREARDSTLPWSRRFRDRVHALRQHHDLEPVPVEREQELFVAPRILLASHPLFGKPGEMPGRELVQTGFWLHEPPQWTDIEPTLGLEEKLEGQPAPLVLAFSSQPLADPAGVLNVHLEAARRLGRVLLTQPGWAALQSAEFEEACSHGEAAMLPVGPQNKLFALAGAVITHGGIGTVARALASGAPLLVEPYGNDQFYNARQVIGLGVGAAVNPHHLTADGLTQILQAQVLTAKNRSRTSELAPNFDSNTALKMACQQIEQWLVC